MGYHAQELLEAVLILPTLAFLIVSLLIGLYASRRIQGSVRNYFVAGNVIPFWVLVFSMSGQAIELGATHDNANLVIAKGFWDGAVLPIGVGLSLILIGIFFAKPLHGMRLLTLPDYYSKRYNTTVGALVALISTISFIILIAGNLAGLGMLLQLALDIPPVVSIPFVATLVTIYTIAGGLFAVTWNDVLQIGVSLVAFSVGLIWTLFHVDQEVLNQALAMRFSWGPLTQFDQGSLRVWASLLALALGDIVALDFMERVFAAGSPRAAQSSCIVAGLVTIAIGIALAVLGMVATVVCHGEANGSLLLFVERTFPPGLRMLFLMGLIGAGLSTIDGAIMACSVALSRNVLSVWAPTMVPASRLLLVSRGMAVPVGVIAVLLALVFPVPAELLVLAFDVVFSGCLVPLVLGIYWPRGTARAAVWAIVVPSVVRVILHFVFEDLGLDSRLDGLQTLMPPILSLLLFVGISLSESANEDASEVSR